jgi:pyridoxal phosphate enzyme (YggS family)
LPSVLEANLTRVRGRIEQACAAARRPISEVELLAVTKSVEPEVALGLARLGVRDCAENRVDQLERKVAWMQAHDAGPRWHMIGHLQGNKVRRAVRVAQTVHSVDSLKLLAAIERAAAEEGRHLGVYLELKLVDVDQRTGLGAGELDALLDAAPALANVDLLGLMTMAAPCETAREGDLASQASARATFRRLREIAEGLSAARRARFAGGRVRLSMGMSSDLEAAIHEGAHVVRVGSALFEGLAASGART